MGDIKLFHIGSTQVSEITGAAFGVEKSLQTLIEQHLDTFFGVRFLASEYWTGKTHNGRIDTLGIDENGFPVIIEYKRALNENVINQGLYYLSWLLDHQAEFELLVQKRFGRDVADKIDWSDPRVLCIAGDFTRYDEHSVHEMNRSIELIRYRKYGEDLLLFELVNVLSDQRTHEVTGKNSNAGRTKSKDLDDIFHALDAYISALGDDVQKKQLKLYLAYKRIKNFACVEMHAGHLIVFVKIDPDSITLERGFTRDVRSIGHWGTGDLEIRITSREDLEKAKPLIQASYEAN